MIAIHCRIDAEQRTVTWKVDETPPEFERDGTLCHAVDEVIMTPENKAILAQLGYRVVAAEPTRLYASTPLSVTYYVARNES